jgi:hypothetical protein
LLSLTTLGFEKCGDNKVREAAKASDRIATLIGSLTDTKRQLAAQGIITPEEELTLTRHLLSLNGVTKTFNDKAKSFTEDDASTRLELAAAFQTVTDAITALSSQAIFPIGNAEAKAKLIAILNSINAAVQIVDAALKG